MNKLEEIFAAFDADKNGFVSAKEICLDNVTADILEIYTPMLLEMEASNVQLDKDEFIESSLALYHVSPVSTNFFLKTLEVTEKNMILKFGQDVGQLYREALKEETFQPQINQRSEEMLKNKEKLPVEKRLIAFNEKVKEKITKLQSEQ